MTSKEIRQSFLDFFKAKEHRIVPSAPVVPHGDPTLLFTNAGMNQFKDVFLGSGKRDYSRAADTQKCIRVSGKHNDLEEVGVDTYHHTFFEMLGNWSFGDYYKSEAIKWAWQLLTEVWKLDPNRLYATVFRTDDEAYELWKRYLPEERIQRFDEKDNFWEMGDTGPCGPCSEIHYDATKDISGGSLVNAGRPEVIEIWNLVFIQYNRKPDGSLEELSAKHVDTGMGFERICAVINRKESNYDTDIFMPLIEKISSLSGKKYKQDLDDSDSIAMRVMSDHIRTLAFAIADGALPGNEGRGYVLRRILRRGMRFARNLGFNEPVLYSLLPTLIEIMGEQFPELVEQQAAIERVVKSEEESFLKTLDRGLDKFDDIVKNIAKDNVEDPEIAKELSEAFQEGLDSFEHILHHVKGSVIDGKEAFQLYDTYGFPIDLTQLLAREKGLKVDMDGFDREMKKQKDRSRKARKVQSQEVDLPEVDATSKFIGYDELEAEATVLYVADNKLVTDITPFYAESGGQVSDNGKVVIAGESYDIVDVKKSGDAIIHICDHDLEPTVGQKCLLKVDEHRRNDIMRNHSATHLLHEALRTVLGDHVKQSGSLVAPEYLRFDFNHFDKVSDKEIKQIEEIVNEKIFEKILVDSKELSLEEAGKNPKIKMFFGDKYGDTVRVVTMDQKFSLELCGGTHVENTNEIGYFKITSESSIAAGIRRIEAVTGRYVKDYIDSLHNKITSKEEYANSLLDKIKFLEKQLKKMETADIGSEIPKMIDSAKKIADIRVATARMDIDSIDQLRNIAEKLRDGFSKNGIALLAMENDGKVQLVCSVTDDLKKNLPAGKLVGAAAKTLGGGGGGKPHMATAGAKNIEGLDKLLSEDFYKIVEEMLG